VSRVRRRSIFDLVEEYLEGLEESISRLSEQLFERPSWDGRTCTIEPLRNVYVYPTEVVVTVDLPFAEESTISVEPVDEDALEVSAKLKRRVCFDDFGMAQFRGEFQELRCLTRIPVPVHMDRMEVRFKRGVLEVRLPRKRGYTIPVR